MATALNTKEYCANDNEKSFFDILKDCLSKDFLFYAGYKYNFDSNSGDIDFIVLHPSYGLWIIEQKSFRLDNLIEVGNTDKWLVKRGIREVEERNPYKQANDNSNYIKGILGKNTNLTNNEGNYKGKLKFPINHFVVFDEMPEKDLIKANNIYSEKMTLAKDFIYNKQKDESDWENKFKSLRIHSFLCKLSNNDIEEIKKTLGISRAIVNPNLKEIGVTDVRQENLIKDNFNQHLLIEGPAGSGKTIIIVLRAIEIKIKNPEWNVGIFVLTKFMANYIRTLLSAYKQSLGDIDIKVYDIFEFANSNCIEKPDYDKFKKLNNKDYFIPALLSAIQSGIKDDSKLDAILVDEGQDITETYAKLYRAALKENTNSITICFDSRQDIYAGVSIVDSLNAQGFNFGSRPKPLIKQQRSVLIFIGIALYESILNKAKPISEIITSTLEVTQRMFFEEVSEIFEKEIRDNKFVGFFKGLFKSGKLLAQRITSTDSLSKELNNRLKLVQKNTINECIDDLVIYLRSKIEEDENVNYGDFLIIFPFHTDKKTNTPIIEALHQSMAALEIPYTYIGTADYDKSYLPKPRYFDGKNISEEKDNRLTADLASNSVKIMTASNSKGYDRKYVFVLNFDDLEIDKPDNSFKPHALSYVILTRAVDQCVIYYKSQTTIIDKIISITDYIDTNKI